MAQQENPGPKAADKDGKAQAVKAPTNTPDPAAVLAQQPEAKPQSLPQPQPSHVIEVRSPQYMIQSRQAVGMGVQALSVDLIMERLQNTPGIEFLRTIEPPRLLALQDTGSDSSTAAGPLVLARMAEDKAVRLQSQAGARLLVERDHPLVFSAAEAAPAIHIAQNPGVVVPHADGFEATIEVHDLDGKPLEGADVYVFGTVWPAQAITDGDGRATVVTKGESPDTIQALYVKPKLNNWSLYLSRPRLVPGGALNTVQVKAIDLPSEPLLGWGQRVMGLDQLPEGYDGAGIRVAVIDSGAAQATHRNLGHVGPGRDIVGDGGEAGWTRDSVGHGSHCAGIIAGTPGNEDRPGMRGFAPKAEVHVCRIFPGGRFSDLAQALDYCIENEIDVVNLSLGGGEPSRVIEERLIKAKASGIACIVAAGNSGGAVQFPASTPHVLAVAALGKWGEFPDNSYHAVQALDGFGPERGGDGLFPARFSCFGPEVDVCAPGVAIVSSLPADGFGAWDGTSMAAPHVTGLASLVLAHHPDFQGAYQTRNAQRVERLFGILKETASPLDFGDVARTGAGLPYAPRALSLQLAQSSTDNVAAATAVFQQLLAALSGQREATAQMDGLPPPSVKQESVQQARQLKPGQSASRRPQALYSPQVTTRGPARTRTVASEMALQSAESSAAWDGGYTLQELRSAMIRARLM